MPQSLTSVKAANARAMLQRREKALGHSWQTLMHSSATEGGLQLPSPRRVRDLWTRDSAVRAAHLCAHGKLGLGALGRAGVLLLSKGVGVLHDRRAGLAQAQGAPADLCRRLQIQYDVRRTRAVMLGQPAAALTLRKALETLQQSAACAACSTPALQHAPGSLQLLLRCGLTRPLWRVAESLHHASADHDCLLHVGFPARGTCLLVA